MAELLQTIIEQNNKILTALDRIGDNLEGINIIQVTMLSIDSKLDDLLEKLDKLDDINDTIASVDNKFDTMDEIKSSVLSIESELQWHEELSAASQIIKSVESVSDAIREQS